MALALTTVPNKRCNSSPTPGYDVVSHDRYHREQPWYSMTPEMRNDQEAMQNFWAVLLGTTEELVGADIEAVLDHLAHDPAASDGPMESPAHHTCWCPRSPAACTSRSSRPTRCSPRS